ncbi:MAG: molybdate ABC transporter permease subunit [Actinobacteria bacterium]|nr:molybdate ABC transporter permease subunit [Actinomycetota bacterium]
MSVLFPLRLSLQVAACATVLTMVVGVPLAYVLARKRFAGRNLVNLLVTFPLVLPPTVTGYLLLWVIGKNGLLGRASLFLTGHQVSLTFTWYAAVIASAIVSLPLLVMTARASMETVDQNLIAASYTLGRSESYTFFHIVVPLSSRGIIAGGTLAFARAMGEFGATLMVAGNIPNRTTTMPIVIYNESLYGSWRGALWLVLIFLALAGVIIYVSNRVAQTKTPLWWGKR